jgi:hypothetical protein
MPKPAITTFSSLAVSQSPTNKDNGFYAPQLTQAQIDEIPASTLKDGAIVYNLDTNQFQFYSDNAWQNSGDVQGPAVSVAHNIVIFADNTGKVIEDSGISIALIPAP